MDAPQSLVFGTGGVRYESTWGLLGVPKCVQNHPFCTGGVRYESTWGLLGVPKCVQNHPFCSNFINTLCTQTGKPPSPIGLQAFLNCSEPWLTLEHTCFRFAVSAHVNWWPATYQLGNIWWYFSLVRRLLEFCYKGAAHMASVENVMCSAT